MMETKFVGINGPSNRLTGLSAESILEKLCAENRTFSCIAQTVAVYSAYGYSIKALEESFEAVRRSIEEGAAPAIQAVTESFEPLTTESLFFMVPPHIKHLAYNHPKHHVRNKNWNRMWKIRERYMRCHKQ